MSIEDFIQDALEREMLFPLLPQAAGEVPERALLVCEGLWAILTSPDGDDEWEQRVGKLRADLERFVNGDIIEPKYLFLLYRAEEGVWEIRSVLPDPSIRVLGCFAMRNVFVATNYVLREDLDGWQDRTWKAVKRLAKTIWNRTFLGLLPIISTSIHDVVTRARDGKYFKQSD
jgi:hypothetical protein